MTFSFQWFAKLLCSFKIIDVFLCMVNTVNLKKTESKSDLCKNLQLEKTALSKKTLHKLRAQKCRKIKKTSNQAIENVKILINAGFPT